MRKLAVILAAVAILSATTVSAGTIIPLKSQAGLDWTALVTSGTLVVGETGTTVAITPHGAWAPNGTGLWISYDKTGIAPDTVYQPYNGQTPVVRIFQSFLIPNGMTGYLTLKAWADDTAFVYLNGADLFTTHTFGQSTCERYPISCAPNNYGSMARTLQAGKYTLAFDVFQIGQGLDNNSNPFGVKWEGQVDVVPEPGSMLLLGTGLFGLAGAARRRFAKK